MHATIQFILAIMLIISIANNCKASWNIAAKGRSTGPNIHTTYFLTPNNAGFDVTAKAYLGKYVNGICVYGEIYDMGTEFVMSGDLVDFDAFKIKEIVGMHYNCLSVYYTYKQLVIDTFVLIGDGVNYYASIPPFSEVHIL